MADEHLALFLQALEEVAGPALILDDKLAIAGYTKGAPELVGNDIPLGTSAAKVLCGSGPERPVAEALSRGEPVTAEVMRPSSGGESRMVQVRATPLSEDGEARQGWLLLLEADAFTVSGPDAEVDSWGIVTKNAAMKQLLRQIARVARSNASVLVRGETGAGKELVASAIHRASTRASGPFRAINCAALPAALLESELFGHARGAFTGAVRDAPGHFRLAEGGTLFLDEVGELPLEVQAKLLRVLQEKRVVPVGGREPIDVDVRIVAATHRSLREAVAQGTFRADLMYRLRVIPLFLPPLRQRPEDVAMLAQLFVERIGKQTGREVKQISPGALLALERYTWPGNVRELQNVIEYAMVMGDGPVLADADLPPEILGHEPGVPKVNVGSQLPEDLPEEAKVLLRALERSGGHQGRAAQSLGMSRVTLWRRLRKYGLDKGAGSDAPPDSSTDGPQG
jgi:transcriptional regulator with PAS, ATPase and Fis domain